MCTQPETCPNPDPLKGQFCATCGMQASKRFHEFQSADPPLPDFLFEALNEALFTADGMAGPTRVDSEHVIYRLIGNIRKPDKPREFHLNANEDLALDLTATSMQDEIAWFKRSYAAEFMKVQETYGGIVFKWGYLQWFS